MWTSYEAICELGGPAESHDEADDPKSIFGVPAPTLSPRNNDVANVRVHRVLPFTDTNQSSHSAAAAASSSKSTVNESANFEEPLHSFKINRYGTPSTPYSGFDRMKIGGNFTNNESQFSAIGRHGEVSGTRQYFHRPATASTIASRARETGGRLPQTNLFNATPSFNAQQTLFQSPIGETHGSAGTTPNNAEPASAVGYANQVLDRARRVVAGLYYEPSPEATNPNLSRIASPAGHLSNRNKDSSVGNDFVPGNVPPSGAELSFSSNPPATPHGAPSPFHAGVSSVKGEKRSLFPSTNDATSHKRPAEEKVDSNTPPSIETVLGQVDRFDYNKLDSMTESQSVGKVLGLLCSLGAAYKFLCQVSRF